MTTTLESARHLAPARAVRAARAPAAALACLAACGPPTPPPAPPTFVGRAACVECHELEDALWTGSHHDLAMQEATPETVLGDFEGATFEHYGVTTTFRRDGQRSLVTTDGPDGAPTEYEVRYVFGVDPLQQLLIPFPDGRLQALSVAWDSRPAEDGGQRWFHLYPDEPIPAGDLLHWTGPQQNWNGMCADCHSTMLRRGYDASSDSFHTTWEELDVSCEACHGPGSAHVAWAREPRGHDPAMGLSVSLKDPAQGQWELDLETGNATRTAPRGSRAQSETCARCHSRRSVLRETPVDGRPFLDAHRLSLLEERLYHADGQILDEVYVYGSFLQSKMYGKGVTCSDCHDPHTARTLFPDNELCARCHVPEKYDAETHHHHPPGPGTQCVDCHMPPRTYMVVDPRHDHSLRVPRPDLTLELGTPNACNGCHDDQSAEWADEHVRQWFPEGRSGTPHWAEALAAARAGDPDAGRRLTAILADPEVPAIVRATGLALAPPYLGGMPIGALAPALEDPDPLVRTAAVQSLEGLPPVQRLPLAWPRLDDPVLAVRVEAARQLAGVPDEVLDAGRRARLEAAVGELRAAHRATAERAGSRLNLGIVALERGERETAEAEYRAALGLDPHFVLAAVNLADLYRSTDRDAEGEAVLRETLAREPQAAALHHALGLCLVRSGRLDEALEALGQAAGLAPEEPRYAFTWALALAEQGDRPRALLVLADAARRHPNDLSLLHALATRHRDAGQRAQALRWAERLAARAPGDPEVQQLLAELRAGDEPPR